MDFNADHFALFELPRQFALEPSLLNQRYREIQAKVHPDKFVQASDTERRLHLQWATRINEAYQVLKKPLSRGQYLLELSGHDLAVDNNLAMSSEFLIEQMEWREAVAEARSARKLDELERLQNDLEPIIDAAYAELANLLNDLFDATQANSTKPQSPTTTHSPDLALDCLRRLMFLEKLRHDIAEAMSALDD